MKTITCIEALEGLTAIGEEKLPVSVSYKIAEHASKLKEVADSFFESRNAMIKDLRDKHGDDIPEEANESFISEVQGMLEKEVDLDLERIDLSSCDINVNAKVLAKCLPVITVTQE